MTFRYSLFVIHLTDCLLLQDKSAFQYKRLQYLSHASNMTNEDTAQF